jgi:ABC-type polysaccharide/polyol phosphate export permease
MEALPDVWVHRRPKGISFGPLDGPSRRRRRAWAPSWHTLFVLTRNEFRARYRSQALGLLWSLLNPLVQMSILSVIFSRVPAFQSAVKNFPVFMLLGVLVWQSFSTAMNATTQTFITHADIVKRTVFPRALLPLASILSYGINFMLEASLVLLLVPFFPHAFSLSPALVLVPLLVTILFALLIGLALVTSTLNVIYRDVAYLVTTSLTLLYWLTPIIYPSTVVPEPYQTVLHFNPLASILIALRGCIMDGAWPSLLTWAGMLGPTVLSLGAGWLTFRHYEREVLDYV